MTERFLTGTTIAFSVSRSPDLMRLGMSPRALDHAVIEIARYFLRAGARIAYGGDLRENGFTLALYELVRRYRRDDPEAPPLRSYLAWSKHSKYSDEFLQEKQKEYAGAARIILLDPQGNEVAMARRHAISASSAGVSMTAMRERMAADCDVRVLLGGKVTQFGAKYPGLAEEAALAFQKRKTVLLIGGFGGSTRDVSAVLGFGKPWKRDERDIDEPYRERYDAGIELVKDAARLGGVHLAPENEPLADSRNLPEIIGLVQDALRAQQVSS